MRFKPTTAKSAAATIRTLCSNYEEVFVNGGRLIQNARRLDGVFNGRKFEEIPI